MLRPDPVLFDVPFQETSIPAIVLSESSLSGSNVSELTDLNNLVPSLELRGTFNMRVPIAMRGISTNRNQQGIGVTSGVSISIEWVPVPADAMGVNELGDKNKNGG
jgi:iron complex outermembrane receptor protein